MIQKKYIPNILTSSRIVLIPVFIFFLFSDVNHGKLLALFVFGIASATDAIDGYYARKHNLVSKFGIFFDPLADKLLVLSAFYGFMFIPILSTEVKIWMIVLISFRDVLVTVLRMIMQYRRVTMVTSKVGKLKTLLQMSTITLVLVYLILFAYDIKYWQIALDFPIIYIAMVVTTLVTFYTGMHYFYYNYRTLGQLLFQK